MIIIVYKKYFHFLFYKPLLQSNYIDRQPIIIITTISSIIAVIIVCETHVFCFFLIVFYS